MTRPLIMIVSRDEDTRIIFGAALAHAGYGVRLVADPDSILHAVGEADPAVIVTNHPTRLADGRTVTQAIRTSEASSSIPVISATTRLRAEELRAAAEDGVDVSLPLPLSPANLVDAVSLLLTRHPRGAR